jgi:MFS transporter, DHA2 family, multidrug resistance protein
MPEISLKAGRKEWVALCVLMLALLLVAMDISVVYYAVPYITEQLEPSTTQQLWMFDTYGFVLASLYITMGSIGDRIGRRKLLMIGAVVFGIGSVIAAYSETSTSLILARVVMAIGGATLEPTALALLRSMFHDPKQRTQAVAIFVGTLGMGVTFGPVLSGLMLSHFWWGSIFLINVPFMLLLLAVAPLLLPESKNPAAGRFDLLGSALTVLGLFPLIYGIKELAAHGGSKTALVYCAVGVLSIIAFIIRQKRASHPMLDMRLISRREVAGPVLTKLAGAFGLIGFAVFTAQYLQSVQGRTPLNAALWSLVPSIGVFILQPTTVAMIQKGIPRAYAAATCFVLATGGFVVMTQLDADSPLWMMLVAMTLQAGGLVSVLALGTDMLVASVSEGEAGSATAVLETGSLLGGSLGMALLGSLGAHIYRSDVNSHLPAGLPSGSVDAVRDTLGGALVAAQGLPGQVGPAVTTVARDAFTHGLNVAALSVAVFSAVAAILIPVALRSVGNGSVEPEDAPEITPPGVPMPERVVATASTTPWAADRDDRSNRR